MKKEKCQWCNIRPEFKNDLCKDCFRTSELNRNHEEEQKLHDEFVKELDEMLK